MSVDDRLRWEERHADARSLSPRESVLALPPPASVGSLALDLASGQARHANALRAAGWDVVAMDVSRNALRHARSTGNGGSLMLVQADVDAWPFLPQSFDLVVQVDFLDRRIFPLLRDGLRADGLLLIDTFLDLGRPNRDGPSRSDFLIRPGELASAFAGMDILRCEETNGETARAILLARRSSSTAQATSRPRSTAAHGP